MIRSGTAVLVPLVCVATLVGCGAKDPCGGAGPADEIVRTYERRLQTTLREQGPPDDASVSGAAHAVFARAGEVAAEVLRGHGGALKERAAWRLRCVVREASLPDTSGWEEIETPDFPDFLARRPEDRPTEDAMRALLFDPLRAVHALLPALEAAAGQAGGTPAARVYRMMGRTVAPPELIAVSRDAARPTLALVSAAEVVVFDLEWKDGWYEPAGIRWLRRPDRPAAP